jgi:hypothetical protein
MKTVRIDPAHVDLEDRTYHFPWYGDGEPLLRSVMDAGVLNPPFLREKPDGKLIPVMGRRRLRTAAAVGISGIEARIIPEAVPVQDAFTTAFRDNFGHRTFDSALTAVVVRRLLELFPRETVAAEFLPALGIPPRGPRLERLRAVGGLEEPILEALAGGKITMRSAVILTRIEPAERLALFEFTRNLRLNANKADEVIDRLFDLSVLHGGGLPDLIRSDRVTAILDNDRLDPPGKTNALRELLREWKFPELAGKMREFDSWRRGLDTGERIVVRPAAEFEDERVSVRIEVDSREKTESVIKAIRKAIE